MPKALSLDIRRRIVRYVANGHSRREAAAHFEVAPSCAIKLVSAHIRSANMADRVLFVDIASRRVVERGGQSLVNAVTANDGA